MKDKVGGLFRSLRAKMGGGQSRQGSNDIPHLECCGRMCMSTLVLYCRHEKSARWSAGVGNKRWECCEYDEFKFEESATETSTESVSSVCRHFSFGWVSRSNDLVFLAFICSVRVIVTRKEIAYVELLKRPGQALGLIVSGAAILHT